LAVKENSPNQINLSVYPNPASQMLNVELSLSYLHTLAQNSTGVLPPISKGEGAETELQIINVLGKVIKHLTLTTQNSQIDVSGLANGVYFVQVYEKGKLLTVKKLVKE